MNNQKKEITKAFHMTVKDLCTYLGYSITGLNKFCSGQSKNPLRAWYAVQKLKKLNDRIYEKDKEEACASYKQRSEIVGRLSVAYEKRVDFDEYEKLFSNLPLEAGMPV